jgi:hypothetical protein
MLNNYFGVELGGEEKNNILIHALYFIVYEIMINLEKNKFVAKRQLFLTPG